MDETYPSNRTTKGELFARAKASIESGDQSYRSAAEYYRNAAEALAISEEQHAATQREMAEAVGRSLGWVNALLQWHKAGYRDETVFGPGSKAARERRKPVQAAERGGRKAKASKAEAVTASVGTNPAAAENASGQGGSANGSERRKTSPQIEILTSQKPSPEEAKSNLLHAISKWWPHMDDAGRAEVIALIFKQKGLRVA